MSKAARKEGKFGVPKLTKPVVETHKLDIVAKRLAPAKQIGKGRDRSQIMRLFKSGI